jgi:hypothetical protein
MKNILVLLDAGILVSVVANGIENSDEDFVVGFGFGLDEDSGTGVVGEEGAEEAAEAVHGDFFVADEDGVAAVDDFEGDEFSGTADRSVLLQISF